MNLRPPSPAQKSFFGTLEQCVEQYGGKSQFTVSAPITFFSGARMETHRRAQSADGSVLIIERELSPTTCEIYVRPTAIPPHAAVSGTIARSTCA